MGSTGKVSTPYFTLGTAEPGLQQQPGVCTADLSPPLRRMKEREGLEAILPVS